MKRTPSEASRTTVLRLFLNMVVSPRWEERRRGLRRSRYPAETTAVPPEPTQPGGPGSRLRDVGAGPSRGLAREQGLRTMATTHISLGPIERYLQTLWERDGSDLLLTAYSKPLVRIDGQLLPIEDEPVLDQDHCRAPRAVGADRGAQAGAAHRQGGRLLVLLERRGPLPGQLLLPDGHALDVAADHPAQAADPRPARPAARDRVLRQPARRDSCW